ncbi:hypothetical protein GOODEAATRI_028836 [Goodea atripinnis]|uniref:Uncharacterized protein n=1 Tax=Goodea atripinnis TaxID=208336 RepID=A0ABV0P8P0_9TELE
MTSVGTICLCPACHTGYIMNYDLHTICEGCLGPDHVEADASPVHAQGLLMSVTTPLPAMGALVSAMPELIAKVADAKGVSVPVPLAQLPTDDMAGKFAPAHPTRQDPVWPRFLAVTAYLSGVVVEPLVSTFTHITRVESLTDQGFPPVPMLDPSLLAVFGVRSARRVGRRLVLPSSSDQITTRLTDRSHHCAAQVPASTNNTAFLACSISKKAWEMELQTEDVEEFCNFADTIVNLFAASAVCSSRIAAWQTLLQKQMWLWLSSSIPEDFKRELLEGPITSDGLADYLLFIFHCISPSFINTFIVIGLFEETSDTQLL